MTSQIEIQLGPLPEILVSPIKGKAPPIHVTLSNITETISRTVSNTEIKYKCTITSERLSQLKKTVENAVRDKKTFTIKGGWQTLRNALISRQWIEKYEPTKKSAAITMHSSLDEICINLPSRQIWETPSAHTEKCERIIMSRLLQMHEVDFYWNIRKDQSDWHHRVAHNKIISRFARSLFTSKEGLCLLLQQMYWYNEPGVASVSFPRCYVLGFPDHFHNFIDDFRLTACVSLLKWYTARFAECDSYAIQSPEGKISLACVDFAIKRCEDFTSARKHLDIDKLAPKVWEHEWDNFIAGYYGSVHESQLFLECKDFPLAGLEKRARIILQEIVEYLPQNHLDGVRNIWIMKPGNKCRGRGIQLIKNVEDVAKVMNMKLKFVVQKYIERPLIIYETKFDIRQWFMVTSVQPLVIWMYEDSYLRFSSQIFNLENFHESLHLTNHAVQCKYTNVNQRNKALPDENMWDCHTFKTYLKQIGHMHKWADVIFPGMKESIIGSMLACQETMDRRPNTFELYGADFMIDEEFQPWLLEINSCPDLSPSTSVTARMCPQCLEDVVKVIIDRRKDPRAETGLFDCIYKQNLPRAPAYLGMSLSVRGRRIFKNRTKQPKAKDSELLNIKKDKEAESELPTLVPPSVNNSSIMENSISLSPEQSTTSYGNGMLYNGPIIGDLMEELHNSYYQNSENGVDFVPAVKVPKKKSFITKDRVPKSDNTTIVKATNQTRSSLPSRNRKRSENVKRADAEILKHRARLSRSSDGGNYFSGNTWTETSGGNPLSREKTDLSLWQKETASILKSNVNTNVLLKYELPGNLNNNNKSDDVPRCLSSISLRSILPHLSVNNHFVSAKTEGKSAKSLGEGVKSKTTLVPLTKRNKSHMKKKE